MSPVNNTMLYIKKYDMTNTIIGFLYVDFTIFTYYR